MDSHLKAKVKTVTLKLAREEQERLRAAGTMIELEELVCEIGDEVTKQLLQLEMTERSDEAAEATTNACPDCGDCCSQAEPKQRQLTSLRGEIHYHEPSFYCPACRRSFFPDSRRNGTSISCDSHS